jgi:hypothetical protein
MNILSASINCTINTYATYVPPPPAPQSPSVIYKEVQNHTWAVGMSPPITAAHQDIDCMWIPSGNGSKWTVASDGTKTLAAQWQIDGQINNAPKMKLWIDPSSNINLVTNSSGTTIYDSSRNYTVDMPNRAIQWLSSWSSPFNSAEAYTFLLTTRGKRGLQFTRQVTWTLPWIEDDNYTTSYQGYAEPNTTRQSTAFWKWAINFS